MEVIPEGFKGEKAIVTPYSKRIQQAENPITKQLYLTHIGYYPKASFHYRKREEGANEHIVIYCESGKGWVMHDNEKLNIGPNTVYIIPANDPHSYGADTRDPWSIYWLHFQGENAFMYESIMGHPLAISYTDNSRQEDRFKLFEDMYFNLEMGYNFDNLEYISFCLMYFLASIKYLTQFREVNKIRVEDTVQQCIIFMKDNLEKNLSLEEIASTAGYSISHLNALFVEKTSYPPMAYYNQLRIQRACAYLQSSDLKISEIAFKLGYYDPFHFSKAFSKEMKISPREYRKKYWPSIKRE